ncbi:MAG: sensor histidine kinase [Spirochaetota bacterium]
MKELEASNKELEQFASVVSHDLKGPLSVVISYINLMKKKYTDKEAKYLTEQVIQRTHNMLDLIDNLLHYSRAGKVNKEDLEVCDCELILQSATENLKIDIESNNAKITHSPLPKIYGYKVQLISLFQNLLSNAIKYRKEDPPNIHIYAKKTGENNEWLFSFKDNGIGINSKKKDKIFLIFHREKAVYDKYSGYGIGLAYCKKIVENHNGKIWVESEPDKGSTFYFTINTKPVKE